MVWQFCELFQRILEIWAKISKLVQICVDDFSWQSGILLDKKKGKCWTKVF